MISCSDHPLRWVQHIAFRKEGKMNFWQQRQYRWDRKNKPEGSGPAVANWGPTRHYKCGKDDPKTSPMPTAVLWICTGSASCPLSPCLPNSPLTFILRSPKTWHCHPSLWIEKIASEQFPGIWCVSYMSCCEAQWWEGCLCWRAGSSICWDCFCLRPPLRAGACLGAVRRLSSHLGGVMNYGWGQGGRSKV